MGAKRKFATTQASCGITFGADAPLDIVNTIVVANIELPYAALIFGASLDTHQPVRPIVLQNTLRGEASASPSP